MATTTHVIDWVNYYSITARGRRADASSDHSSNLGSQRDQKQRKSDVDTSHLFAHPANYWNLKRYRHQRRSGRERQPLYLQQLYGLHLIPPGLLNLSISAAFSGALQRTQANISITILQSEPISNPVPVSDSQGLFSLSVPASWASNAIESQAQGAPETEDVDFNFPDGTTLFTIIVYPISTWGAMQTSDEPLPVYLGQNSQFVFAYSGPQDGITGETVDANSIAQTLPQLLATFKITQQ